MPKRSRKRTIVRVRAKPRLIGSLVLQRARKIGVVFGTMFLVVSVVVWLVEKDAEGTHVASFLDAIWLNVCTISTVGYGDTFPVTLAGRGVMGAFILFTIVAIGFLLSAVNEAVLEVKGMEEKGLFGTEMKGHIVVCGFGPVAQSAIEELLAAGRDVAVICSDEDLPRAQRFGGGTSYFVTAGEITQDVLRDRLNIDEACAGVVATTDDTANIVASLNIRAVNPKLRVVVAVGNDALRQTLVASGVTYVASPFELSGRLVASAAFEPEVAQFIDDITSGIGGHDVQQYSARAFEGQTVREVREKLEQADGPLLVGVAVWRERSYEIVAHPPRDLKLGARDHLLVLATDETATAMAERFDLRQGR